MNIEIIPADHCHAHDLAPRLRETDMNEVFASGGYSPLEALTVSVDSSDEDMCWVAVIDGVPEIMWGVGGLGDEFGVVWLLGSDIVKRIGRRFWMESKENVRHMHNRYPRLTNWVHVANIPSLTWLKSLGFEPVEFDQNFGHLKQPFIRYESRRPQCVSLQRS